MSNKIMRSGNSIKRLLKDVADIMKAPLVQNGIYYVHDEENMYKGTAMIIGPKDTPYENGYYFFKFQFPKAYPFRPPKLTYCTNDGTTRFNPNLYECGKVCVSILNTWKGEQWTSCQTIRSSLLTLTMLLNNNPLTNEPGFNPTHRSCIPYKRMIQYMNYKTAILGMLTKSNLPGRFQSYYPILVKHFIENKQDILNQLKNLEESNINGMEDWIGIYSMRCKYKYTELRKLFLCISEKL